MGLASINARLSAFGPLLLRVVAGGLLAYQHGWGKLTGFSAKAGTFTDPLGVGSRQSLMLTILGEFFAPLFVILGLGTRVAAVFPTITMLVIAFKVHGDDALGKKELPIMFGLAFATLILTGAGPFSLDALISKRKGAGKAPRKPPRA